MRNLLNKVKKLAQPFYLKEYLNLQYLQRLPRYTAYTTKILGTEIKLVDSASFVFMYQGIFRQEIYKFKTAKSQPLIIDGGANIGLSTILKYLS